MGSGAGGLGIEMDGTGTDYCNILDNTLEYQYRGIYFDGTNNCLITNNSVNHNTYTGIYIWRNSMYNTIANNSLHNNSNWGIFTSLGSNHNIIRHPDTPKGTMTKVSNRMAIFLNACFFIVLPPLEF